MFFGNKKKWNTDLCYNMDETNATQKQYTSICMKCSDSVETESQLVLTWDFLKGVGDGS